MSNNCISCLLIFFLFSQQHCDHAWVSFLWRNSDWDHVVYSSLFWIAIKLHQTGVGESLACWINSIPRSVGLPLHSLALRAGLNRKYQKIKIKKALQKWSIEACKWSFNASSSSTSQCSSIVCLFGWHSCDLLSVTRVTGAAAAPELCAYQSRERESVLQNTVGSSVLLRASVAVTSRNSQVLFLSFAGCIAGL